MQARFGRAAGVLWSALFMPEIALLPDTVLCLKRPRVLQREEVDAQGRPALHVFYGEHQITFESDTLAFGRGLIAHSRFRADDARSWCEGPPRAWSDTQVLLAELLGAGILERDPAPAPPADMPRSVLQQVDPAAPMPPLRWRTLDDLCRLIAAPMEPLLPVDLIESTLGAGLLAQLVRDPSGRQCGENTLAMSAPALSDPVPSEWRRCRFPGSRFEDRRPMNVSGLRQLAGDFDGLLGGVAALRAAFVERFGGPRLDLGRLWLLAWTGFVVPAWAARRSVDRCENGAVPEWATALSKTFGGIRLTLQLLLVREGRRPESEVTVTEFLRVTEEGARYLSDTGVCAGTPKMIEGVVEVLLAGAPAPARIIPGVAGALDYGIATAPLPLIAAAREARSWMLIAAAGAGGAPLADGLAAVVESEGDPADAWLRAITLATQLKFTIDPMAPALVAAAPLPGPSEALMRAILAVEAAAVRLSAIHQERINHGLGIVGTPVLTRRHVAAGLSAASHQLIADRLAAGLGWVVADAGMSVVIDGQRIALHAS